jgi:Ni2+-binding GTPase involved in maturation of urease and hydrogenase
LVVRREENDCETLHLFRQFSQDNEDEATAVEAADALRQYVIPCLMEDADRVIEVPGSQGVSGKTFLLIFLARDGTGVRGVAVMVVDCRTRAEAERRLAALQRVMQE